MTQKRSRFLWATALWAMTLILCLPVFVTGADAATQVEIKADRLRIQSNKKIAVFEGNVTFSVDAASFICRRMVVKYDDKGSIETANAEGGVIITQKDAKAIAERAVLNIKTGIVTLEGYPRFTRNRNTLSGKRIRINMRTGEVDVIDASGTFVFTQDSQQ